VRDTLNNEFCREAVHYHAGLICAYSGKPEEAAAHFDKSRTLPHAGGPLIFPEQQRESLDLYAHQAKTRKRGMPSVLITSMPRSASASFTQTLAATLSAPRLRFSAGDFPNYFIVPRWLNAFTPGGAVSHDHFGACPFNIEALHKAGVDHLFVLVRDPRSAAHSFAQLKAKRSEIEKERIPDEFIKMTLRDYIPWLTAWIDVAIDQEANIKVHWLRFTRIAADLRSVVREVLSTYCESYPAVAPLIQGEITEVPANYAHGDDHKWRELVGEDDRQRLWKAIPDRARELLELTP